jgi:hypothetical protein
MLRADAERLEDFVGHACSWTVAPGGAEVVWDG